MKRWGLFIALSWYCLSSSGQQWFFDDQTALQAARQENKYVLIYFAGSDWCPWCQKLKSELIDRPEFTSFAQANLELVDIDSPRYHPMADLQLQSNRRIKRKYHVTGYPTLVVLDPNGNEFLRMEYEAAGLPAYLNRLGMIAAIREAKQKAQTPPPPAQPDPPPRKPATLTYYLPSVPFHYGPLTLKSISGTKQRQFVLINNATLTVGDTADVRVEDKDILVVCKEIRSDSVLITADGKPMELKLATK